MALAGNIEDSIVHWAGGLSEAWLALLRVKGGGERGEEILPHEAFEGRMY